MSMVEKAVKTQKQTEKFDIKEIYTPLSVAKKEIWRRWNDKELRKKVEDFLGGDVPKFLQKEPKAAIVRHISSPNFELAYFLELVKGCGLNSMLVEFTKDKFVDKNRDKYHLCKLFFYNGLGKKFGEKIQTQVIIDFQVSRGKRLCDIKTLDGENLVDFHHRILSSIFPESKKRMFDISEWFYRKGPKAKKYYIYYLALFICHGVLFENFSLKADMREKGYDKKVVIPGIKKLVKLFGVKPLIVPILPLESESALHWWHYPAKIEKIAKKMIEKKKQ